MQVLTEYAWPGNVRELENVIERLLVTGRATRSPPRSADRDPAPRNLSLRPKRERRRTVADDLYKKLVEERESFWTAVYPLYMQREITRGNVRDLVRKGLEEARGNYKIVAQLFNMEQRDYKRFLNFSQRGSFLPCPGSLASSRARALARPCARRGGGWADPADAVPAMGGEGKPRTGCGRPVENTRSGGSGGRRRHRCPPACAAAPRPAQSATKQPLRRRASPGCAPAGYVIGADDVLTVVFWRDKEMSGGGRGPARRQDLAAAAERHQGRGIDAGAAARSS